MNILVGYNGSESAKKALELAKLFSKVYNAKVFVVNSMEGGSREKMEEIQKSKTDLEDADAFFREANIECETHQLARGFSPGEDIVMFANENNIDHIFTGIEKKSKTQKLIMGSTAQYIILKAQCPVTTVK